MHSTALCSRICVRIILISQNMRVSTDCSPKDTMTSEQDSLVTVTPPSFPLNRRRSRAHRSRLASGRGARRLRVRGGIVYPSVRDREQSVGADRTVVSKATASAGSVRRNEHNTTAVRRRCSRRTDTGRKLTSGECYARRSPQHTRLYYPHSLFTKVSPPFRIISEA